MIRLPTTSKFKLHINPYNTIASQIINWETKGIQFWNTSECLQIIEKKVWLYTKTGFIWYFKIYNYSRYIIKGNSEHIHTKTKY